MIEIYNLKGKILKSIPNEDEYFKHISAGELLEVHPEYDKDKIDWSFVIFPPKSVHNLYLQLKKESLTRPIQIAYEQQLGLIEICHGDYANPLWIHMTAGVDIGMMKKEWYLA